MEDIQAAEASKAADDEDEDDTRAQINELETGQARSLICNDCGKRFRNQDLASYHASKTFVISEIHMLVAVFADSMKRPHRFLRVHRGNCSTDRRREEGKT